jgi:hypothetical protein
VGKGNESREEIMELFWVHPYLAKRMEQVRRQELLSRVAHWRLLREADADRSRWFSRQGCWVLCQLGRLLERTGRWLQERVPSQAA